MTIEAIILAVVALVIVSLMGWWLSRSRVQAGHREPHPSKQRTRLDPESRFIVRLSDSEVVCERPDGKTERVAWSDLQRVEIVTTSDGPMVPDVFWVLHGTDGGCAIPQGATGEEELLDRLHALPGFDNGRMIEAMCCATDNRFLCWQRAA